MNRKERKRLEHLRHKSKFYELSGKELRELYRLEEKDG